MEGNFQVEVCHHSDMDIEAETDSVLKRYKVMLKTDNFLLIHFLVVNFRFKHSTTCQHLTATLAVGI